MDISGLSCLRMLEDLNDGVYILNEGRQIVFWNRGAELITGYLSKEVIGTKCSDDILMHLDEEGRSLCTAELCPAQATINDGQRREQLLYLRHKRGHRVPVMVRLSPLRDSDGDIIGAIEVFTDQTAAMERERRLRQLEEQSLSDPLTGLGNRRLGEAALDGRLNELRRYGWPFGVLFVDIDGFKVINDTHGHVVGDAILCVVADSIMSGLRSMDTAVRWGGDEFLVIVGNVDENRLTIVKNKLEMLVNQSRIPTDGESLRVSISVGGAVARQEDSMEGLLVRADKKMYEAKQANGNS